TWRIGTSRIGIWRIRTWRIRTCVFVLGVLVPRVFVPGVFVLAYSYLWLSYLRISSGCGDFHRVDCIRRPANKPANRPSWLGGLQRRPTRFTEAIDDCRVNRHRHRNLSGTVWFDESSQAHPRPVSWRRANCFPYSRS